MSAQPPELITVDRASGAVAIVTIARASAFNTLSIDTLEALDEAFVSLSTDEACTGIVVTGEGGASFAAGADLNEVGALSPREALGFAARGQRVFDRIERAPQLVIAAIDGYCMGGGLDLALACDVRHASPTSVFAHPGAKRGIVTGFGGTGRLPRLVGRTNALELFATGRRVAASEALAIGLVDRVSDDPLVTARDVADQISVHWPLATAWVKGSAVRWWRKGPGR